MESMYCLVVFNNCYMQLLNGTLIPIHCLIVLLN
jgi:hypothetical protein